MKIFGMKVALLGKVLEVPDRHPPNPESDPVLVELKTLLEEEFYNYFDFRIQIKKWDYVFQRALAYRVE
jgi:hypothetical protein